MRWLQGKAWMGGLLACLAVTACVDPGPYGGGAYAGEYGGGYGGGYGGPAAIVVQERGGPGYYGRGYDRGYDRRNDGGYDRGRDRDRRSERREDRREFRQERRERQDGNDRLRAVQERDRRAQEQLYRSQGR